MSLKIFHLLFTLIFLGAIAYELYAMYFAQKSKRWPTTNGTILNAQVETSTDEDSFDTHEPLVHYSYRVDGVIYESKRLFFGKQYAHDYFEASDSLLGIHKNKKVTVYYDPSKPQRSVLQPGAGHVKPYLIIIYIILYTAFLIYS